MTTFKYDSVVCPFQPLPPFQNCFWQGIHLLCAILQLELKHNILRQPIQMIYIHEKTLIRKIINYHLEWTICLKQVKDVFWSLCWFN